MDEASGGTPARREAAHPEKGGRNQSHHFDRTRGELAMLAFRQGENRALPAQFSSVSSRV